MQKPLVRATVNGSSSGGREERESVIRIGGEENAFSTKTRHGVITVGTQWYVWEDCRLSYSWRRQPRTIRDKPSPKMVCRRDVDPDTAPRNTIAVHPSIRQMDIGCLNLPRHCARRARSTISYSGAKNSRLTCSFLRYFR